MSAQDFWNKIARKYAARPIGNPQAYEATLDRVRAHLSPQDHVLELGCGTASTALLLAPNVARYTATDYAAQMVEIGREKLIAQGVDNITLNQGTALAPELPDAGFDAVLGFNLYHLLDDLDAGVAAAHRLVRPGGMFISKSICLGPYSPFRPLVAVLRLMGKAPPLKFLSVQRLEHAITNAGFEILETGDYPARPRARFIVARKPSP